MGFMKTKQGRRGRRVLKRYSAEDRERLLREYVKSGQSQAEFCRDHGVNDTTFNGWLRRKRGEEPVFAEVKMPELMEVRGGLEIRLPGGVSVVLDDRWNAEQAAELVRRVAGC